MLFHLSSFSSHATDLRSFSWTDGRGDQPDYAKAVAVWSDFHDMLPDTNFNKINADLSGIFLNSQLYGRARDLSLGISDTTTKTAEGALAAIFHAINQRDALSVVRETYKDLTDLLSTPSGISEDSRNYESSFAAQLANLNENRDSIKLTESLTALMILPNAATENGQRISVLDAANLNET